MTTIWSNIMIKKKSTLYNQLHKYMNNNTIFITLALYATTKNLKSNYRKPLKLGVMYKNCCKYCQNIFW